MYSRVSPLGTLKQLFSGGVWVYLQLSWVSTSNPRGPEQGQKCICGSSDREYTGIARTPFSTLLRACLIPARALWVLKVE